MRAHSAVHQVTRGVTGGQSLQGRDGLDLADVKAFNAIAGIGEVIGLPVSLAAGTL